MKNQWSRRCCLCTSPFCNLGNSSHSNAKDSKNDQELSIIRNKTQSRAKQNTSGNIYNLLFIVLRVKSAANRLNIFHYKCNYQRIEYRENNCLDGKQPLYWNGKSLFLVSTELRKMLNTYILCFIHQHYFCVTMYSLLTFL